MKKILLLLIFIFTCAFTYNVNALTLTPRGALNNYASNNIFDTTGIYNSDERPQEDFYYSSALNTSYSRKLYGLRAYFNTSLTKNHTYRLNINTSLNNFNTSAFNNTDLYVCFGSSWSGANSNCTTSLGYSSINSNSISINFRPTSNYSYFSIRIGPQTNKNYPLTTSFSYIITSFTLDDLNSPASSPSNQDVIDNDNQNTQAIIDKQQRDTLTIQGQLDEKSQELHDQINQTETNIINNQNNNAQDIIYNDTQNTNRLDRDLINCQERTVKMEPRQSGAYIAGADGRINTNSGYMVSKFYRINYNGYPIKINFKNIDGMGYGYLCNYNEKMQLMGSCIRYMDMNSYSAQPFDYYPSGTYITFTYKKDSGAEFTGNICNTSAETSNDIYNYISDGNIDSSTGQNFFGNFQVNDFGLSSIVTAPLQAINTLTSATCSPLVVPIPFTNSTISLPCMSSFYQSKIPEIYQLWQIVSFGIIAYYIINSLHDIIHNFREPDNDCLEVLDL